VPAWALDCEATLVDDAKVISQPAKVEAAAGSLGNQGLVVKIRTVGSLRSGESLESYLKGVRDQCASWRSGSNWKSNLLVLAYSPNLLATDPKGYQLDASFGAANASRLGNGVWQQVLKERMVPEVKNFAAGDKEAITVGFVNSLNGFEAIFARPIGGGNVSIHQAADLSGLWTAMKWLVAFIVLAGGGIAVFLFFRQRKEDSDELAGAQAETRRLRGDCVGALNGLDSDVERALRTAAVAKKPTLKPKLDRLQDLITRATSTLHSFDAGGLGEDPNESLSVAALRSNAHRYGDIISNYIEPARALAKEIDVGDDSTHTPKPSSSSRRARSENWTSSRANSPRAEPAPQASAPAPAPTNTTTVVHEHSGGSDNFLTGLLVGEALRGHDRVEHHYHRDESPSRSDSYSRSRDDDGDRGGSFTVSTKDDDDDRGGVFAVDTSSDSSSSSSGGSFSASDSSSSSGGSFSASDSSSSSSSGGGSFSANDS
jgi:hypothetical protein